MKREKTTIALYPKKDKEKTIQELYRTKIEPITKKIKHFPLSLLWVECKECGINEEE